MWAADQWNPSDLAARAECPKWAWRATWPKSTGIAGWDANPSIGRSRECWDWHPSLRTLLGVIGQNGQAHAQTPPDIRIGVVRHQPERELAVAFADQSQQDQLAQDARRHERRRIVRTVQAA